MSWTENDSNSYRTRLSVPGASMILDSSNHTPTSGLSSFTYPSPSSTNTMGLLHEVLQRSLDDSPPPRRLVSQEGLQLLKTTIKVRESESNVGEHCPITHMPFQIGDAITSLPCGHRFGDAAIRRWLMQEKAECPICRAHLPHIEDPAPAPTPRPPTVQPTPAPDSISRSRQLRRSIEQATDELRSMGLEPYIAPSSFINTRARVNIRSRMPRSSSSYIMSPEIAPAWRPTSYRAPGPTSGSIQPPAESAAAPRERELLDGIFALAFESLYS